MADEPMTLEERLEDFLASRAGERWKSGDIAEFLDIDDKREVALALGSLHKDSDSRVERVDHGIYMHAEVGEGAQPGPLHEHDPHRVSDAFLFEQDPTMTERSFVVVAPHGTKGSSLLLMDDHGQFWVAKRAEVREAED